MRYWNLFFILLFVGCQPQVVERVVPQLIVMEKPAEVKGTQVYHISPSGLPEVGFPESVSGKQVRYVLTSRIASGFRTQQIMGTPTMLHVRVTRGSEDAWADIRINGDTVQFEIVGDVGDLLSLDLFVRDEHGSTLGEVQGYEIILQENMTIPVIEIVLSGGSSGMPMVSPVDVRIVDERLPSIPTPLHIGVPGEGTSGPQDPYPTSPPDPVDDTPPGSVQDNVIVRVAEHSNGRTTLDVYDVTSSTHKTVAEGTVDTMLDVAYYRTIPTNTMLIIGKSSLQTAPFEHQYRNGKWNTTVGTYREDMPYPFYDGYVTGRSDDLQGMKFVRVLDSGHLLIGAPHPVVGDQWMRLWIYNRQTGRVDILSDDSRHGEFIGTNAAGTEILYGERSSGRAYEWSLFTLHNKLFQSLILPSGGVEYPVAAYERAGGKQFAYYRASDRSIIVRSLLTQMEETVPVSSQVEALCWNDTSSRLAAVMRNGGTDVYAFPGGYKIHEGIPYPNGGKTTTSCQFMN